MPPRPDDLLRLQGQNLEFVTEKLGTIGGDFGSDCTAIFHFSFTDVVDEMPQAISERFRFILWETWRDGPHLYQHRIICEG